MSSVLTILFGGENPEAPLSWARVSRDTGKLLQGGELRAGDGGPAFGLDPGPTPHAGSMAPGVPLGPDPVQPSKLLAEAALEADRSRPPSQSPSPSDRCCLEATSPVGIVAQINFKGDPLRALDTGDACSQGFAIDVDFAGSATAP